MKTKAQGLSMSTVVIAALVLIVLVVLIMIFSNKMGGANKGLSSCSGECVDSVSKCSGKIPIFLVDCDADGDGEADGGNYCCPD